MLKLLYTACLLLGLTNAYSFVDIDIYNRISLQIIFGSAYYELNTMSEYDFLVYGRAVEYTLTNLDELGMIEWNNSTSSLSGKITIIAKKQDGDNLCKSFIHSVTMNNKVYEGEALGCNVSGQWIVKKL